MKKIIPILLLCLVLICFLPMGALKANAAEYTENGWKYTVSNGKATVVGHKSSNFVVTVPSKLGGYPVTTIGPRAFENYLVTSITIPDSVTTIEDYAFNGCKDLTRVTIGNGVTEIKKFAFCGCSRLQTVTLGESVKKIRENAFSGCESLTTINFPEMLTSIYEGAFSGCKALTKITIPDYAYLSMNAFSQCSGLTEVILGANVTTINTGTFSGCTALKTLRVTNSLTSVKEDAFKNCTALKTVVHYGEPEKMQQLKNKVEATGNEYLKNASWVHAHTYSKVNEKAPTCTEPGKRSYYQCGFCGQCSQTSSGNKWTIPDISTWGIIAATGHSPGAWQSNSNQHWQVCSTCKTNVNSASHSGGTWQSDGTNHWKVCSTCQQKYQTSAHSGGTSTCRSKKQCSTCNAAYGNLGSHSWSKTWDHTDANGHYHKCQTPGCGQLSPAEAHAPSAAATETREQICTVCSYIIAPKLNHQHTLKKYAAVKATCEKNGNLEYYACTGCAKIFKDAGATKEYPDLNSVLILASGHQYSESWNMNEIEHWRACSACGAKDGNGAHIPGAEATETTDQTCLICSYVIEKAVAHTHTFSSYWFNDDSAHWKACACGEVSEKANHADTDGDHACDSCRWALEGDTQETTEPTEATEATEPEDVPETTEGGNEIPEKNDKQGGISPVVIVVCILGVLALATGAVLVVILVKRKKQ